MEKLRLTMQIGLERQKEWALEHLMDGDVFLLGERSGRAAFGCEGASREASLAPSCASRELDERGGCWVRSCQSGREE